MQAGHARAAPVPLVRGGRAVHALLDGAAQPARGSFQCGPGAPSGDRADGLCLCRRADLLQRGLPVHPARVEVPGRSGGRAALRRPHFADIDLVIPVPLHWTRLRSRGYNQAEILARALVDAFHAAPAPGASAAPPSSVSERCPVVAGHDEGAAPTTVIPGAPSAIIPGLTRSLPEVRTDLLVRARRTRTQTRVSVDQKAQNVASAFQVPARFSPWARFVSTWKGEVPESPAEVLASARHILLVDDTFTTGATLYACYAALRPFTTARISIATLAAVEGTPSSGP